MPREKGKKNAAASERSELLIIWHLTDQGMMDPELLYKPPFTDVAPTGPEQLFDEANVVRLFRKIQAINETAVA
jgi:type I restriction enzyme, R subunit